MASLCIESIVDLKFSLEREIALHNEIYNKVHHIRHHTDNVGREDCNKLLERYRINVCIYGVKYIEKQKDLLKEVNSKLLLLCKHNWIEDTIEDGFVEKDICYCSRCFCRKPLE